MSDVADVSVKLELTMIGNWENPGDPDMAVSLDRSELKREWEKGK